MLWSLLSSAYIVYLYRKLKAERAPAAPAANPRAATGVSAALDELDGRLGAIEARLAAGNRPEPLP